MSIPVFSVTGLIAWLETQDPETEYPYQSNNDCLLCRYFRARGIPLSNGDAPMGSITWGDTSGNSHVLPEGLNAIAWHGLHTYGDALARAKEAI